MGNYVHGFMLAWSGVYSLPQSCLRLPWLCCSSLETAIPDCCSISVQHLHALAGTTLIQQFIINIESQHRDPSCTIHFITSCFKQYSFMCQITHWLHTFWSIEHGHIVVFYPVELDCTDTSEMSLMQSGPCIFNRLRPKNCSNFCST